MEINEKERVGGKKKTILFANKTMCTKDGRHFALTSIYLVVITAKREREKKSRFSPFLLSLSLSLFFSRCLSLFSPIFYLQALEAITTNRNIGTSAAYNIIHTDIERPLAFFFSQHYFLSLARLLACSFFFSKTFSLILLLLLCSLYVRDLSRAAFA